MIARIRVDGIFGNDRGFSCYMDTGPHQSVYVAELDAIVAEE